MLNGRLLLENELPSAHIKSYVLKSNAKCYLYYRVQKRKGIQYDGKHWICARCHSYCDDWVLPIGIHYCRSCLQYHRVTERTVIYSSPWHSPFSKQENYLLEWNGTLSKFQKPISDELVKSNDSIVLIHAVTGAGKTEMVYHYIHYHLNHGERVAYVAPRIDVVKELSERFRRVFPQLDIPCLYGGSQEKYRCRPFTVMTIQQLIRFQHCFDRLLIDEVDAFPYAGNSILSYFTNRALTQRGQKVYLTATLTEELEKRSNEMKIFRLPIRYHLNPLPVPCIKWLFQSYRYLKYKKIPPVLKKLLVNRTRQVLFFFPNIEQMLQWEQIILNCDHTLKMTSVSSRDDDRDVKIEAMRQKKYEMLLTTMILERGVTFENIDVWIMDAHHRSFTKAALIQISGRAGRKKEYPTGNVYWIAEGKTRAMLSALDDIKKQNQLARQWIEEI